MRFAIALTLVFAAIAPCFSADAPPALAFYVAPDGSDDNPGTREAPVATVRQAARLADGQPEPAEVVVRGGVYFLDRTVTIPRSNKESRLTIRSAEGERAVFDGSVPLKGAKPLEGAPGVYIVEGEFPTEEPPTVWDADTGQHFSKLADLAAVQATDNSSTILDERTMAFRARGGLPPTEADIRMSRRGVMHGVSVLRSNTTLHGLEFRNFVERRASAGVQIGGTLRGQGKQREGEFTSGVVIDSCRTWNCYFGFRVNTGAADSRIVRSRPRNGITGIWVSGIDTVVEGNEIVNDPDWHPRKAMWARPGDWRGVSFYHKPEDAVVRNNFIKGFRTGIFSKGSPGEYLIENNTVLNSRVAIGRDATFVIRRNIFAGFEIPFRSDANMGWHSDMEHNLFWDAEHDYAEAVRDPEVGGQANNHFADPLFASPRQGDYRLLPGSPALRIEGGKHAGALPPVPEVFRGPPNLRVILRHVEGAQSRDPFPPTDLPPEVCYVSSRGTVEADLTVSSVAPPRKTRYSVNGGPVEERPFSDSDAFDLPGEHGRHTLRFQVMDANGNWSAPSEVHVAFRPAEIQLLKEPTILANRYGALFSFQSDRYAWGKLEYHDGERWVEASQSEYAKEKRFDPRERPGRGWQPHDYREYYELSTMPLQVAGLAPDTPHRYRLTISTPIGAIVREGTFTLSGPTKIMYVSTEGEDAEGRGSREAPYRSIQYALDRALPGDRVRVKPGVYFGPHILRHGGTEEAPLVIEGLYPDTVTIDGLRERDPWTLFLMDGAHHTVLRNLNFRWFEVKGVQVRNAENVRIEQCRFHNQYWVGGAGINGRALRIMGSPNFAVERCIFTRVRYSIELSESPGGRVYRNTAVAGAANLFLWRGRSAKGLSITHNSFNWNGNSMLIIEQPKDVLHNHTVIDYNNYGTTFRRPEGTPRGGDEAVRYGRSLERPYPFFPTNREFVIFQDTDPADPDYPVQRYTFANMEDWLEVSQQDKNSIFADPKWVDPRAGRFDVAEDSPNLLPDGQVIGALGHLGEEPNMKPEVVVAAPYLGQEVQAPFAVEAHASDYDGTVEKVQFFAGETLLGEATAPPYRIEGVSLAPGRHSLTARAVDDQGGVGVSDAVDVVIAE